VLDLVKKGYDAVKSVAQSAYGAYETAKQQVISRQGLDVADPYGMRQLAIGAQMLRNAQQKPLVRRLVSRVRPSMLRRAALQWRRSLVF